jgi:hypothetical protein
MATLGGSNLIIAADDRTGRQAGRQSDGPGRSRAKDTTHTHGKERQRKYINRTVYNINKLQHCSAFF